MAKTQAHKITCTRALDCERERERERGERALFSALEQTLCTYVTCDSECVTVSFYSVNV